MFIIVNVMNMVILLGHLLKNYLKTDKLFIEGHCEKLLHYLFAVAIWGLIFHDTNAMTFIQFDCALSVQTYKLDTSHFELIC